MSKTRYKHGQYNVQCDVCGIEYKSGQIKKRWDGLMVCKRDWEERHPSDFFRSPRSDNTPLPYVRPAGSMDSDIGTLTAEITVTTGEDSQVFTIEVVGVPGVAPALNPDTATSVPSGTFSGAL